MCVPGRSEPQPAAIALSNHAALNGWVDRSTVEIKVELPAYNAELGSYALVQLRVCWRA